MRLGCVAELRERAEPMKLDELRKTWVREKGGGDGRDDGRVRAR